MGNYYNDETHEYYVDGVKKPSVTEICSPISFQRLTALAQQLLERARARGSRCHEIAEEYLLLGEIDEDEIESEYFDHIRQFVLWAKTYRPKVIYTEKKLYGNDFCGTADLICEIDGKTILVDYKFTATADKKSLSVQLEGYYRLCKELGINIDECWYLHIRKDGYTFKQISRNPQWFDLLLQHYKFMKETYKESK